MQSSSPVQDDSCSWLLSSVFCAIRRQRLFFHLHHYITSGIGGRSLQGFSLFSTLRWRNTTLEFDQSSIRRYRFGSYRCKQQATRDECGEAWLDTERDEIVRSRGGTVA